MPWERRSRLWHLGLKARAGDQGNGVLLKRRIENGVLSKDAPCVFCKAQSGDRQEIIAKNATFVFIYDKYPVNPGHGLLFPRRHVESLFELNPREWRDLRGLLSVARDAIDARFHPQGYNIGINCGEVAGQTVPHLHVHLIPRYEGDVENPRGGLRNFKQPLVPYS